jgi:hypothetical protein
VPTRTSAIARLLVPIRPIACGALMAALLLIPASLPPGASVALRAASDPAIRFMQITATGMADPDAPHPDLTYGTGNESPTISDAGDIAFISDADLVPKGSAPGAPGNADGSDELFLFRPDAAVPLTQLTNDPASGKKASATISRDGGAIAFVWARPTRLAPLPLPRVYLYLTASRRTVPLTENGGNYGFTTVSDRLGARAAGTGRYRVAFTRFHLTGREVLTVDVVGGAAGTPAPVSARQGRDPSISRDGRKIVYAAVARHSHEQIILHTAGAGEKAVTDGDEDSNQPRISADGRAIAFASRADLVRQNADHNREIFLYQAATGRLIQITHTAGEVENSSPTINGDGTRVAFLSNGDLVGKNADGNPEVFLWIGGTHPSLRQVTDTKDDTVPSLNSGPYLIGSGRRLLFRSTADLDHHNSDNSPEIFLASGL